MLKQIHKTHLKKNNKKGSSDNLKDDHQLILDQIVSTNKNGTTAHKTFGKTIEKVSFSLSPAHDFTKGLVPHEDGSFLLSVCSPSFMHS